MRPSSVLFVFLLLCCLQMMLVSMPTCRLPGKVVQNTHNLLRDLGAAFPAQCHQYKIRFPDSALSASAFPDSAHSQCHWTSALVYESLQGAGLMFDEYELPEGVGGVTWDEQKLDHYLNLQYRLVEDHLCLNNTEAAGVLSPYFRYVQDVVEQKDSAACGWQALRRDLLWLLKSSLRNHHNCFNWTRAQ
ncbi:interferon phi 3 [Odontesthes bonariensis]|uniref:interferon phi 3 n=1 Tax=Odontesthes bonariensis TaxID=219752 RepID=UPI003F580FB8